MNGEIGFVVEMGGQRAVGTTAKTASWDDFAPVDLGTVSAQPGEVEVRVRAKDPANWKAINLRAITLTPE